jgi:hypothetical protein
LLGATLRLTPDEPEADQSAHGRRKEPSSRDATARFAFRGLFLQEPPASTIGTGKIIDEMGMKGQRRGSAVVSPSTRTSSSLKARTRAPKMRWHSRKRFANASNANRESNWNMRSNSGAQTLSHTN